MAPPVREQLCDLHAAVTEGDRGKRCPLGCIISRSHAVGEELERLLLAARGEQHAQELGVEFLHPPNRVALRVFGLTHALGKRAQRLLELLHRGSGLDGGILQPLELVR